MNLVIRITSLSVLAFNATAGYATGRQAIISARMRRPFVLPNMVSWIVFPTAYLIAYVVSVMAYFFGVEYVERWQKREEVSMFRASDSESLGSDSFVCEVRTDSTLCTGHTGKSGGTLFVGQLNAASISFARPPGGTVSPPGHLFMPDFDDRAQQTWPRVSPGGFWVIEKETAGLVAIRLPTVELCRLLADPAGHVGKDALFTIYLAWRGAHMLDKGRLVRFGHVFVIAPVEQPKGEKGLSAELNASCPAALSIARSAQNESSAPPPAAGAKIPSSKPGER
jgi:hypothetical protein